MCVCAHCWIAWIFLRLGGLSIFDFFQLFSTFFFMLHSFLQTIKFTSRKKKLFDFFCWLHKFKVYWVLASLGFNYFFLLPVEFGQKLVFCMYFVFNFLQFFCRFFLQSRNNLSGLLSAYQAGWISNKPEITLNLPTRAHLGNCVSATLNFQWTRIELLKKMNVKSVSPKIHKWVKNSTNELKIPQMS